MIYPQWTDPLLLTPVLVVLIVWSLVWKGWALWRAARNNHRAWYIALLIINTIGLLEIVYIFGFSGYGTGKKSEAKKETKPAGKKK